MKTTLNLIRSHSPCESGWEKLLKSLGKTKGDDEPLSIITILESNGLDDALWCLRAVENEDKKLRLFLIWCARKVQHLLKDERSIKALDVAEAFANGDATKEELDAARDAAWAARDAAWAARDAAGNAAARDDAWAAAWAARAAGDAAWAAAGNAAGDAAWAAAGNAAWAAAWDAAGNAAARDAVLDEQEKELRRICEEMNNEPVTSSMDAYVC